MDRCYHLILAFVLALLPVAASAQVLATPVRLSANSTYYVAPTGTDDTAHGTGTGTAAFKTIAYGVKFLCANVDAANYQLTLSVAPGTYTDSVHLCEVLRPKAGGWPNLPVLILGNISSPCSGPLLSVNGDAAVVGVGVNTYWEIEGFQLQSTIVDVEADFGTRVYVGANEHGACAAPYPSPQKLSAIYGGRIEIVGPLQINAGGMFAFDAQFQGMIVNAGNNVVTVSNNPTFSTAFAVCEFQGLMALSGMAFSGTAVGSRYLNDYGSGISTSGGGPSFFPGSTGGSSDASSWLQ